MQQKQPKQQKQQAPSQSQPQMPAWGWALILLFTAVAAFSLWQLKDATSPLSLWDNNAEPARQRTIRVHVRGSVLSPGVYDIPAGSRASDAVEIAGGADAKADLDGLNLARFLKDGDSVQVPAIKAQPTPSPQQALQVDVNLADVQQLQQLPGISQATAEAIIQYRRKHGAFLSLDELTRVKGIGAATLEQIRPLLVLE